MQRRETAHREPHNMRRMQTQVSQDGLNVIDRNRLRVRAGAIGNIRWRIPAGIKRNRAAALPKVTELGFPTPEVARELMHKDQWTAGPGLFVIQANTVIRQRERRF